MRELIEDRKIKKEYFDAMSKNFGVFVRSQKSQAKEGSLALGDVPKTQYWLIKGNEVIGQGVLHHRLNRHLKKFGGHVGYSIRPSFRNKGYGTALLLLMLKKAKKFGFEQILLTCREGNKPSIKIIEHAGGVFKKRILDKNKIPHVLYDVKL